MGQFRTSLTLLLVYYSLSVRHTCTVHSVLACPRLHITPLNTDPRCYIAASVAPESGPNRAVLLPGARFEVAADGERHCQRGTAFSLPHLLHMQPRGTITDNDNHRQSFLPDQTTTSTSRHLSVRHTGIPYLPHLWNCLSTWQIHLPSVWRLLLLRHLWSTLHTHTTSLNLTHSSLTRPLLLPSSPRWRHRLPQGRLRCPKLPRVPVSFHRGPTHPAY